MSTLRQRLVEQLARFDDEAYAALANRGLLRRARKDLETQSASIVEESADTLTLAFAEHRIQFTARGPAHAQCSCPASGVCQHILAAAISLQGMADGTPDAAEPTDPGTAESAPLAQLQAELLGIPAAELLKHAGKAGYRWAWQFVEDLDPERGLTISGERHLVLSFGHPSISFRYMGGGIDALIADTDIRHIDKYRVAAIIACQRAHGIAATPPEAKTVPRTAALDLGKDHAAIEASAGSIDESRQRLRNSALQLFRESIELGLSHLSQGIHERYATLAVWAQGAEYPRLALLLRRIADHVELLLERAGGADEHRLLDELSLACGLVSALEQAAAKGSAPQHLIGRARSRYEAAGTLELLGLGASAWRSPAGYVGLTMLFWSPGDQAFLSCADARPENQRGFNPVTRYTAPGPWSGLGAPQQATGRRIMLTAPQINAAGRLSASENTSASSAAMPSPADFAKLLRPHGVWVDVLQSHSLSRRSLLAEAQPMKDWVVLQPKRFAEAKFDAARQTLIWPVIDENDQGLDLELRYDEFTRHAIARIEALRPDSLRPGTLVVARLRPGLNGLVGEPLSLVRSQPDPTENPIDALHFDAAKEQDLTSKIRDKMRRFYADDTPPAHFEMQSPTPEVLREFRHWLHRQAERGAADSQAIQVRNEAKTWVDRAANAGLDGFRPMWRETLDPGTAILRLNYASLQHERLMGNGAGEES